MDTKLVTTELRLTQWKAIIEDRIQSGMTINEYCAQHQLSRNAYFYWLRRVKKAAIKASGFDFVELPTPDTSPTISAPSDPSISIAVNGLTINIHQTFSKVLLSDILEAVANVK